MRKTLTHQQKIRRVKKLFRDALKAFEAYELRADIEMVRNWDLIKKVKK